MFHPILSSGSSKCQWRYFGGIHFPVHYAPCLPHACWGTCLSASAWASCVQSFLQKASTLPMDKEAHLRHPVVFPLVRCLVCQSWVCGSRMLMSQLLSQMPFLSRLNQELELTCQRLLFFLFWGGPLQVTHFKKRTWFCGYISSQFTLALC